MKIRLPKSVLIQPRTVVGKSEKAFASLSVRSHPRESQAPITTPIGASSDVTNNDLHLKSMAWVPPGTDLGEYVRATCRGTMRRRRHGVLLVLACCSHRATAAPPHAPANMRACSRVPMRVRSRRTTAASPMQISSPRGVVRLRHPLNQKVRPQCTLSCLRWPVRRRRTHSL